MSKCFLVNWILVLFVVSIKTTKICLRSLDSENRWWLHFDILKVLSIAVSYWNRQFHSSKMAWAILEWSTFGSILHSVLMIRYYWVSNHHYLGSYVCCLFFVGFSETNWMNENTKPNTHTHIYKLEQPNEREKIMREHLKWLFNYQRLNRNVSFSCCRCCFCCILPV